MNKEERTAFKRILRRSGLPMPYRVWGSAEGNIDWVRMDETGSFLASAPRLNGPMLQPDGVEAPSRVIEQSQLSRNEKFVIAAGAIGVTALAAASVLHERHHYALEV